jgi:hypothetical protein
VRRVTTKLEDSSPPRIVQSFGSLLAGTAPQQGQRHLALSLSDKGGGLYIARVDVDGERMTDLPYVAA